MDLNIFEQKLPSFGLHLNSTALKFVELESHKKNVVCKAFGNIPVAKNLMTTDTILDAPGLSQLIEASLRKPKFGKLSTNRVVIGMPESKSFVRMIQIPLMSEAEADNAVIFEAEAYIPLPMDQVYLDWQIVKKTGDKMDVLIIASPKNFVDQFTDIVESAGLKVVAVEVESQSVLRAVLPQISQETLLIVDLDANKTTLAMVEKGNLQFTSSIPLAGNIFTEKIAQSFGISSKQAESLKKEIGIANTPEYPNIKTILLPSVQDLSTEIKNILKFHYDHSTEKISRILLSGGGAKLKNLAETLVTYFDEEDNLKVEIANPWMNLSGLKTPPLSPYEALSFTTAIGLAMRELKS